VLDELFILKGSSVEVVPEVVLCPGKFPIEVGFGRLLIDLGSLLGLDYLKIPTLLTMAAPSLLLAIEESLSLRGLRFLGFFPRLKLLSFIEL
jgi:hypothetical protein